MTTKKEMTDEEVFGKQEMSDQEVFGKKTPKEMAAAKSQEYTSQFLPVKRTKTGGYEPAVPGAIQSIGQAITAPGRALMSGSDGDYMEGKGGPGEEEAINFALNLAGTNALKKSAAKGVPLSKAGQEVSMDSAHNAIMKAAQDRGYRVPPVTKHLGQLATEFAGKTETKAEMNIRNRRIDTEIAAEESGVPKGIPVTDEALAAARKEIGKPYEEISRMSPKAGQLWKQVQRQRGLAKAEYNKWRQSNGTNPDALERAEHLDSRAAAKEKEIENIASLIYQSKEGGAAKLAALKSARTRFAKNYMVDRANTPGGQVIGEKISKDKGYKDGGLKLISDFHAEKARYFKDELDLLANVHFGAGVGRHSMGLGGWISHLPLIGYGVRKATLTKMLQPDFGKYKPGIIAKLSDVGNRYGFAGTAVGLKRPEDE